MSEVLSYLFKTKFISGHRRQLGIGLNVVATILAFTGGPLGGVLPFLASPALQHGLMVAGSYVGIVGQLFKDEVKP